ncbi:MAG TPA: PEGA domain-containing protein [Polyangiaceae bacterium]|nr:PEGA domain-containing protein [Polyangiaceae bacterium]
MSDKGGSDLDVFDNLSKAPAARKNTLVGLSVPDAPGPALGSSGRGSLPPPPPPSLRAASRPSAPSPSAIFNIDDEDEAEEVEAVEDASSPLAAPPPVAATGSSPFANNLGSSPTSASAFAGIPVAQVTRDLDGDDDDATRVLSGFGSSPEASVEPPTPYAPRSSAFMASVPPPPPPTNRSSAPVPPPPLGSRPLASLPPPPPPTPARLSQPSGPYAQAAVPNEWDEDDDKTSIYNRESGFDAAHVLMGGVQPRIGGLPDAPPPPMSRPSAPVPSAPIAAMPTTQMRVPPRIDVSSAPPRAPSRTPLWLGIAGVVLAVALYFVLRPTTGGLVVTVAGPGSKPLKAVEVLVDGKTACTSSPCALKELGAGTHMVKAVAEGYQETAETAVLITSGQDAVHNIRLAQASGTGVRVTGQGTGLRLVVDGKEIGPLPQELKDMSPGGHTLKVASDAFEGWEKSVTVSEDEMQSIEVPKLRVLKGLAVIKAGSNADGARILLDTDGDRRVLPELPVSLSIDTAKPTKLIANRKGFESFEQAVSFEDGANEKTFVVELREPEAAAAAPAPGRHIAPPRGGGGNPPRSEPSSGTATLNINSIPASSILLDGRPVGSTPKVGVSVSAGHHTVVFVLDSKRASKSVNATAGQTSTVVHRFN